MESSAGHRGEPLAVTVLFRTRDRPALLLDAVQSVLAGHRLPSEILIVDQSVEPNAELTRLRSDRGCQIRYLHTTQRGLSRATNLGLAAAAEEIVALLDDDMLVEPDWLERLIAGLEGGNALTVARGQVVAAPPPREGLVLPPASLVTGTEPRTYRGNQELDVMPGANLAVRRSGLLSLGGYDERLGAGSRYSSAEDNDMGLRLLAAGGEVRHVPEAVVLHRAWRRRRELAWVRWSYGRGKGAFYAKHGGFRAPAIRHRLVRDASTRLRAARRHALHSPPAAAGQVLQLIATLTALVEWAAREERQDAARQERRFG